MPEHDQRFKVMLRAMFPEFMELFFPEKAAMLDLTKIDWLDKELFLDPPQGEKRELDLVAKVARKSTSQEATDEQIILVHIEVEADDCATDLDTRFPDYYWFLRRKYGQSVLPVAVFLKVGFDGLGVRECEEQTLGEWVLKFRYWYIGLPALDGTHYLESANWLGVGLSSLMKAAPGQRALLTADAQKKLLECPDPVKQIQLIECLQAYAPLSESDRIDLVGLLKEPKYSGVIAVNKTVRELGLEEGQRRTIRRILLRKFGVLSESILHRLAEYPTDKLDQLADAAAVATSLSELGLED